MVVTFIGIFAVKVCLNQLRRHLYTGRFKSMNLQINQPKVRAKYQNQRVKLDNLLFASKKEARRYCELKLLLRAGEIKDLRMQKKYELIPKQGNERSVNYIADFVYFDNRLNKLVVEDTKGFKTKEYIIKRKLMKFIHQIEIKEI